MKALKKVFKAIGIIFLLAIAGAVISEFDVDPSLPSREKREALEVIGKAYLSEIEQEEYLGYDIVFANGTGQIPSSRSRRTYRTSYYVFVDFDRNIQTYLTCKYKRNKDNDIFFDFESGSIETVKIEGSKEEGWKTIEKVVERKYDYVTGPEKDYVKEYYVNKRTEDHSLLHIDLLMDDFLETLKSIPAYKIPETFALDESYQKQ